MIITITPDGCRVLEPDDCARLHGTADGMDDDEAGAALARAGLGHAGEAAHVWLLIDALRTAARTDASIPDWDDRFDAMIGFARSKHWLDPAGRYVAAHIERGVS